MKHRCTGGFHDVADHRGPGVTGLVQSRDGVFSGVGGRADQQSAGCLRVEQCGKRVVFAQAGRFKFESVGDRAVGRLQRTAHSVSAEFNKAVQQRQPVPQPGGGTHHRTIPVEIVAMDLVGVATIPSIGTLPVVVYEDPGRASTGEVSGADPNSSKDFPADSFFDVFFEIELSGGSILPGGSRNLCFGRRY